MVHKLILVRHNIWFFLELNCYWKLDSIWNFWEKTEKNLASFFSLHNFEIKTFSLKLSITSERSTIKLNVKQLFSKLSLIQSISWVVACSVESNSWELNCFWLKKMYFDKCLKNLSRMVHSNILEKQVEKEIVL